MDTYAVRLGIFLTIDLIAEGEDTGDAVELAKYDVCRRLGEIKEVAIESVFPMRAYKLEGAVSYADLDQQDRESN